MIDLFALLTCGILAALSIFQLALIAGAPIGKYAWGGSHTVLPTNLKIGSVISIMLYAAFAVVVLNKAGIITLLNNQGVIDISIWVLAAYFMLGIIMNGVSRSKPERNLMTPIAAVLAILTTVIALG